MLGIESHVTLSQSLIGKNYLCRLIEKRKNKSQQTKERDGLPFRSFSGRSRTSFRKKKRSPWTNDSFAVDRNPDQKQDRNKQSTSNWHLLFGRELSLRFSFYWIWEQSLLSFSTKIKSLFFFFLLKSWAPVWYTKKGCASNKIVVCVKIREKDCYRLFGVIAPIHVRFTRVSFRHWRTILSLLR